MPTGPFGNLPQLTTFKNDSATSVQGLQWDTVVQGGGALYSDLRNFIAYPGQIVLASGGATLGDGNQGIFQFVQATGDGVAPADDNFTILQCPANIWPAAWWQRVPVFTSLNVYDIAMNYSQVPPPSSIFLTFVAARRFTTPLNLVGSQAVSLGGPTTTMAYTLSRNSVQFGTVTFPGGVGTQIAGIFAATAQTWAPGDVLTVASPASTYGSSNVAITIEGNAF